jgi:hypothetical protein
MDALMARELSYLLLDGGPILLLATFHMLVEFLALLGGRVD